MSFISNTTLSDQTTLNFSELKVKHLKQIFKCTLGDDYNKEILLHNLNVILSDLISINPLDLNFLDYFILLFEIRQNSIGNSIKVQLTSNTTLDINLNEMSKILKNIKITTFLAPDIYEDQIKIYYRLPNILEINSFTTQPEKIFMFFLDKIEIHNQSYYFNDFKETEKILNHIPAKLFSLLNKKIQNIAIYFNTINLLSYNSFIKEPILYFNLNINNLCTLIKLLFGDHLMALYENIFALCKIGNFTPEYIENCTPGEYLLYVKKLEEFNRQQNSEQSQPSSFAPDIYGDTGIDEPLNPYESSNLPPITSSFQG